MKKCASLSLTEEPLQRSSGMVGMYQSILVSKL